MKRFFVVILFCVSCTNIRYLGNNTTSIDDNINPTPSIEEFIEPYKKELSKSMNEFLAVLDTSYSKAKPNGNLNNLCADLILKHASKKDTNNFIAFCILNYGGLRTSLPSDSIFVRNIFELSPFENHLVILKLPPEYYDSLFNYLLIRKSDPMAGLSININSKKVRIQAQKFDSRRPIYFVTNNYMADGGDGFGILLKADYRHDLDVTMRRALIEELKEEYRSKGFIVHRNKEVFTNE